MPNRTSELSHRGPTLRWMTTLERHGKHRSVRRGALAGIVVLGLALLVILGPLLLVAALGMLVLAWRAPHRMTPHLGHRWLTHVPLWLRATPMRFATAFLVATLPFAATSYAIRDDPGPADTSADASSAPIASDVAGAPLDTPTPDVTPRLPSPRATARPSATVTPVPTGAPTPEPAVTVGGEVAVHFLDVGQGNAALIVAPDATMLIDTGRHDRSDVVPMIRALGIQAIDVVAITHGHADHIGQLDRVLGSLEVGEVWMSGTPHTTRTFERAITAIEDSTAAYDEPRAGDTTSVGSLTIEILNPVGLSGDIDADMLVMRLSYGAVSFLFTGDLQGAGEAGVVERHGGDLASTIYAVAHHGSNTSSSAELLTAVQPQVAIYSASATNQYGHPHAEVIQRLTSVGAEIYGTAVHGTVTVITDGETYRVSTAQPAPAIVPLVPAAPAATPTRAPASGCQAGQVDINSAAFDELQFIVHIGPVRAQEMLAIRPFSSVDAMDRIDGIGPARLADIKAQGVACVP